MERAEVLPNTQCGLNFGLDFRFGKQNLRTNVAFPGLPIIQFLIASSLAPIARIIQIFMHF